VAAGEGAENGCDWGMRRDVARLDSTRRGGRAAEARGMGHAMAHSVRPTGGGGAPGVAGRRGGREGGETNSRPRGGGGKGGGAEVGYSEAAAA